MVDLARAVSDLVTASAIETESRALRRVVEHVLDGFEEAPERARARALRALGRALSEATGRGAQVLALALGALVEGGASPELSWPSVGSGLAALLDEATAFATAALERSEDPHLDAAIEAVGADVARALPHEAAAWNALPSRCLAAVACLTRSKKLRARARRDAALFEAAWPLSDAVSEVGLLLQALQILDAERLVVLAPESGRGWRVALEEVCSTAEVYVLLANALLDDPRRGLAGKKPAASAVATIEGRSTKGPASTTVPFALTAAVAQSEGLLDADAGAAFVPTDGLAADLPVSGKERVLLLTTGPTTVPVGPPFEGLHPTLQVLDVLSSTEVARVAKRLGVSVGERPDAKQRGRRKGNGSGRPHRTKRSRSASR